MNFTMAKMDDDDTVFEGGGGGTCFPNKTLARLHDFYLVGEIGDPSAYTQWYEIIRNAKESDVVYIHINSPGGNMFTALQMIRCIHESKGTIIASVEGMCLSAATLIFLNTHQCEVSEHSMFMFHNYSSMVMGKGGEMFDHLSHQKKWSSKLFDQIYQNFLTPEEIASILDNKDIWMDAEEVINRLKTRAEKQRAFLAQQKNKEVEPPSPPLSDTAKAERKEKAKPKVKVKPKSKTKRKSRNTHWSE